MEKLRIEDIPWAEGEEVLVDNLNSQIIECDKTNNSANISEMREILESNEPLVECQECFDLFPKEDCMHVDDLHGYICPACQIAKGLVDIIKQDAAEEECCGDECCDGECCCGEHCHDGECEVEVIDEPSDEFSLSDLLGDEKEPFADRPIVQEPIVQDPQAKADYIRQLAVEDNASDKMYDPFDLTIFVVDCKEAGYDVDESDFNNYFDIISELNHK